MSIARKTLAINGCAFDASHAPFAGILTARKRSLQRLCFHRCLPLVWGKVADTPPGETPPGQTPPMADSPWADTLLVRHPPGRRHPLVADTPRHTPPSQTHTPGQTHPLLLSGCWDMVNKLAVRMPLECILVATSVPSITTTS